MAAVISAIKRKQRIYENTQRMLDEAKKDVVLFSELLRNAKTIVESLEREMEVLQNHIL